MSSTILAFEGVVFNVPEEVSVSFSQGSLQLIFNNFTGSLTCSASAAKGAAEPALAPNPITSKRGSQMESKANVEGIDSLTKRPRFESPTQPASDEDAHDQNDGIVAANEPVPAATQVEAIPPAVYQNGGGSFLALSQEESESEAEAQSPVKPPSWEDARESASPHMTPTSSSPVVDMELTQAAAPLGRTTSLTSRASRAASRKASPAQAPTAEAPTEAARANTAELVEVSLDPSATSCVPSKARLAALEAPPKTLTGAEGSVEGSVEGTAAAAFAFEPSATLDCWEWAPVKASGETPDARWAHSAVNICGQMHVFGGDKLSDDTGAGCLSDFYTFDASEARWRRGRDAPQARAWHSGTALKGGVQGNSEILLVFGGESIKSNGRKAAVNTMLAYDPEFEVWYDAVDRGQRPSARSGHSACVHLANGAGSKLLVFGGWSGKRFAEPELHELRIETDWAWRRLLSGEEGRPDGRAYHSATAIFGERVVMFGGNDANQAFDSVHLLDLASMSWSRPGTRGTAPMPRTGHTAVCLDGHRVLVYGGWDYKPDDGNEDSDDEGFEFRDDLYILDTRDWSWSQPQLRGTPPQARAGHSLVALDAGDSPALYLFGGRNEDDVALADLYTLRPVATK